MSGGGSDYALCADLVIASEDAQIGTPYSRVWARHRAVISIHRLFKDTSTARGAPHMQGVCDEPDARGSSG